MRDPSSKMTLYTGSQGSRSTSSWKLVPSLSKARSKGLMISRMVAPTSKR